MSFFERNLARVRHEFDSKISRVSFKSNALNTPKAPLQKSSLETRERNGESTELSSSRPIEAMMLKNRSAQHPPMPSLGNSSLPSTVQTSVSDENLSNSELTQIPVVSSTNCSRNTHTFEVKRTNSNRPGTEERQLSFFEMSADANDVVRNNPKTHTTRPLSKSENPGATRKSSRRSIGGSAEDSKVARSFDPPRPRSRHSTAGGTSRIRGKTSVPSASMYEQRRRSSFGLRMIAVPKEFKPKRLSTRSSLSSTEVYNGMPTDMNTEEHTSWYLSQSAPPAAGVSDDPRGTDQPPPGLVFGRVNNIPNFGGLWDTDNGNEKKDEDEHDRSAELLRSRMKGSGRFGPSATGGGGAGRAPNTLIDRISEVSPINRRESNSGGVAEGRKMLTWEELEERERWEAQMKPNYVRTPPRRLRPVAAGVGISGGVEGGVASGIMGSGGGGQVQSEGQGKVVAIRGEEKGEIFSPRRASSPSIGTAGRKELGPGGNPGADGNDNDDDDDDGFGARPQRAAASGRAGRRSFSMGVSSSSSSNGGGRAAGNRRGSTMMGGGGRALNSGTLSEPSYRRGSGGSGSTETDTTSSNTGGSSNSGSGSGSRTGVGVGVGVRGRRTSSTEGDEYAGKLKQMQLRVEAAEAERQAALAEKMERKAARGRERELEGQRSNGERGQMSWMKAICHAIFLTKMKNPLRKRRSKIEFLMGVMVLQARFRLKRRMRQRRLNSLFYKKMWKATHALKLPMKLEARRNAAELLVGFMRQVHTHHFLFHLRRFRRRMVVAQRIARVYLKTRRARLELIDRLWEKCERRITPSHLEDARRTMGQLSQVGYDPQLMEASEPAVFSSRAQTPDMLARGVGVGTMGRHDSTSLGVEALGGNRSGGGSGRGNLVVEALQDSPHIEKLMRWTHVARLVDTCLRTLAMEHAVTTGAPIAAVSKAAAAAAARLTQTTPGAPGGGGEGGSFQFPSVVRVSGGGHRRRGGVSQLISSGGGGGMYVGDVDLLMARRDVDEEAGGGIKLPLSPDASSTSSFVGKSGPPHAVRLGSTSLSHISRSSMRSQVVVEVLRRARNRHVLRGLTARWAMVKQDEMNHKVYGLDDARDALNVTASPADAAEEPDTAGAGAAAVAVEVEPEEDEVAALMSKHDGGMEEIRGASSSRDSSGITRRISGRDTTNGDRGARRGRGEKMGWPLFLMLQEIDHAELFRIVLAAKVREEQWLGQKKKDEPQRPRTWKSRGGVVGGRGKLSPVHLKRKSQSPKRPPHHGYRHSKKDIGAVPHHPLLGRGGKEGDVKSEDSTGLRDTGSRSNVAAVVQNGTSGVDATQLGHVLLRREVDQHRTAQQQEAKKKKKARGKGKGKDKRKSKKETTENGKHRYPETGEDDSSAVG